MNVQAQVFCLAYSSFNTKDMLLRRHDNNDCVLCNAYVLEEWKHFFFTCNFSSRIWNYLQIDWRNRPVSESLNFAKNHFSGPCFTEVVILACWNIWKQRNDWIFENIKPTFRGWKACFVCDITMLKHTVKSSVPESLSLWIAELL